VQGGRSEDATCWTLRVKKNKTHTHSHNKYIYNALDSDVQFEMYSVRKSSAYSVIYRYYYIRLRCPMLFKKKKKPFGYFFSLFPRRLRSVHLSLLLFFFYRVEVVVWHGHSAAAVSTEKFRHYYIFQYPFAINIFHDSYIYILILQLMLRSAISPHGALLAKRARCRRRSTRLEFLTAV